MQIEIKKLVPEACIPKNANLLDTGYDLIALDDGEIVGEVVSNHVNYWKRIDYIQYKTGLAISPRTKNVELANPTYFTLLFPRSSVSKYNLLLANSVGLVDNPYRGEIMLRFKYIWNPEDYVFNATKDIYSSLQSFFMYGSPNKNKIYKKGDKIAQIAAFELNPIEFIEVNELDKTNRGHGGFGSTGQ